MDRGVPARTWGDELAAMFPGLPSVGCTVEKQDPAHADPGSPDDATPHPPCTSPDGRETPVAALASPGERVERWFHDHFDTLWRFAARLGVPRQHVDDVVQDVFMIASRREASIAPGSERRFLISTTIKISANQRRRCARQLDRPALIENEPGEQGDGPAMLERKRLLELLYTALDELSDDHRSAFVLHELEGFTVPEIAELLGVPQGTAASRVGRARQSFAISTARLRTRWLKGDLP
jgi:RNA polymerase sigma-70 factor (ECF subfamily)